MRKSLVAAGQGQQCMVKVRKVGEVQQWLGMVCLGEDLRKDRIFRSGW